MTDKNEDERIRADARARAAAFYGRPHQKRRGHLPRWLAVLIFVALIIVAAVALSSLARQREANNLMFRQAVCQQENYYRAIQGLAPNDCEP